MAAINDRADEEKALRALEQSPRTTVDVCYRMRLPKEQRSRAYDTLRRLELAGKVRRDPDRTHKNKGVFWELIK